MSNSSNVEYVLVTGATLGGMGPTIAETLAVHKSANYHILASFRSQSKADDAAAHWKSKGFTNIHPVILDLSSDDSIAALASQLEKDYGRLDILIHNAAFDGNPTKPWSGNPRDQWRQVYETNVFGPVMLTDALTPLMKKAQTPRILFFSSTQGSSGLTLDPEYPGYRHIFPPYKSSKAAINNIMAMYSITLGVDHGFQVNAVSPGYVATNMTKDMRPTDRTPAMGVAKGIDIVTMKDGRANGTFTNDDGDIVF